MEPVKVEIIRMDYYWYIEWIFEVKTSTLGGIWTHDLWIASPTLLIHPDQYLRVNYWKKVKILTPEPVW